MEAAWSPLLQAVQLQPFSTGTERLFDSTLYRSQLGLQSIIIKEAAMTPQCQEEPTTRMLPVTLTRKEDNRVYMFSKQLLGEEKAINEWQTEEKVKVDKED